MTVPGLTTPGQRHCGHAETSLPRGGLLATERRGAVIRPAEFRRTAVSGVDDGKDTTFRQPIQERSLFNEKNMEPFFTSSTAFIKFLAEQRFKR